jgi:PAS domain S-box-containing protein
MGSVTAAESPVHLGVRGKLLAPMLACLLAIVGVVAWTAVDGRRQRIAEVKEAALVEARLMASSLAIGDLVRDVRSTLTVVAAAREPRALDADGVRDLFARLLDSHGGKFNAFALATPDGRVIAAVPEPPGAVVVADRAWFREAMQSRGFVVGEIQTSRITGAVGIPFAAPVLDDDGRPIAVLVTGVGLEWLADRIEALPLPEDRAVALLDRDARLIARNPPLPARVGTVSVDPFVREAVATGSGTTFEAIGFDGRRRIVAAMPLDPVDPVGLFLTVGFDRAALLAPLDRRMAILVGLVATIGIAGVVLIGVLAEHLVFRPARRIGAVAVQAADGRLDQRVGLAGADELAELGRQFDEMLSRFAAAFAQRDEAMRSYETLMDRVPIGIYETDAEGRILVANSEMARMFGFPDTDALKRMRAHQLFADPEERARLYVVPEPGEDSGRAEFWARRRDGTPMRVADDYRVRRGTDGTILGIDGALHDVTARYAAEEARERAEAILRAVVDSAPAQVYVKDASGRYVMLSRSAAEYYRLAPEDYLDRTSAEVLSGRFAGVDAELHARAMAADGPLPPEIVPHLETDGRTSWWLTTAAPIRDAAGVVTHVVSIWINVSAHHAAEEQLQRAEAVLRAVVDSAPAHVYVEDAAGRIVLMSRAAEDFYGMTPADYVGRTAADLVPANFVDYVRALNARAMGADGPVQPEIVPYEDRDGGTSWWLSTAAPIRDSAGVVTHVVSIWIDVSAQHEAEERQRRAESILRAVIDATPAHLYVVDAAGRYVLMSRAAEDYYGVTPADYVGRASVDFAPANFVDYERALHARATAADRPLAPEVVPYEEKDGSASWWLMTAAPIRDSAGAVSHVASIWIDITAQHRAEERQRRAESILRAVVESAPAHVSVVDVSGRYVLMSRVAEEFYGVKPEDYVGRTAAEFAPADINVVEPSVRARAIATDGPLPPEIVPYEERDGSTSWWLMTAAPIRDASRAISHVASIWIDITAQHRAERAARESRALLLAALDTIDVMLFVRDRDGRYVLVNQAGARYFGMAPADMVGKPARDLNIPENSAVIESFSREVIATGRAVGPHEIRLGDWQGRPRWWLARLAPLRDERGEVSLVVSTWLEITERKEAEIALARSRDLFRATIDGMPVDTVVKDRELRYVIVNERTAEFYGRTPAQMVGLRMRDVIAPADRAYCDEVERLDRQVLETRRPVGPAEVRFQRPDGRARVWTVDRVPLLDEAGEVSHVIAVWQDVTDTRQKERALAQSQKMDAVGQLSGGIAHDFNNLLLIVIGNLELLREGLVNRDHIRLLDDAVHAAERGADLTRRLLAFSRRQELEPRRVDPNEMVRSTVGLLRRSLGEHIAPRLELGEGLPEVLVDPAQLESAILNLAINARDAMPGGGTLTVRTAAVEVTPDDVAGDREAAAGPHAEIAVGDTGEGMAPEVLEKATQPFFTTKEVGKGSGLGLSMVYGFVRQSGGHMRIESAPGRGTRVRLLLPAAPARAGEGAATAETPPPRAASADVILTVEDEPALRDVLARQLEGFGYRVIPAADAAEALAVLDRGEPVDLLLTDVVMPGGVSGPALADAARERRPGLRIAFMSGYAADPGTRAQLATLKPLLAKPFRGAELARFVAAVLAGRDGPGPEGPAGA